MQPHGLACQATLPWDFPGKNNGMGCHFLLQGIFATQGSNPWLLHRQTGSLALSYLGSPTLLISFICSGSFCVESYGFLYGGSYLLHTMTVHLFPSNLDAFYFSCLIAVSRTSNIMLNRSGKSGHPCLVPGFSGNTFSFSLLSITLVVGLS